MLHHLGLVVRDFSRSVALYDACLSPLRIRRTEGSVDWAIFSNDAEAPFIWLGQPHPDFWKNEHEAGRAPVHIAFAAPNRAAVDAFHAAALANGGVCNGPPGLRKSWADFYSAFILDPDGNNIEATLRE